MNPQHTHVLVIDDDPSRGRLIERVLGDEGFAVTAVTEGLAAIRHASRQSFAFIVAAAELPGSLDGAATVQHIRAWQPWVRVLFIAGFEAHGSLASGTDADVIPDPFHPRDLLGCVFALLQRKIAA